MDQGNGVHVRALTLAAGVAAGSLALAAPAGAATQCVPAGQMPDGGSACLTVDTWSGQPGWVTSMSSTVTYKGYYNFQVHMSEPRGSRSVTPRYTMMDVANRPANANSVTTNTFSYCSAYTPQDAFTLGGACSTYAPGSKVWLEIYHDTNANLRWQTPKMDVNPSGTTTPGCTNAWKC